MSIIERALGKLGGSGANKGDANHAAAASIPDSAGIVERAATELDRAAIPAAAPAFQSKPMPPSGEAPRRNGQSARSVTIDLSRVENFGIMNPERADRSVIAEEFRHIKRPLLANAFGGDPEGLGQNRNLIMVTSAFPGEGKTFCAINLAMSMAAEMDFKVLLVDADVARPSVFKYLGLREERGLLDVLRDKGLDLAEVLLRTNFEKLTLLPAGRSVRHATELLASDAMNQLLAELASRYSDRVIIFDSPPLLPTSEARVLANHMGQVVMVVEADKTPTAAIKEAATLVEDACDIVMLLLNKTNVSQSAAGYYGYGYGYGHEDA